MGAGGGGGAGGTRAGGVGGGERGAVSGSEGRGTVCVPGLVASASPGALVSTHAEGGGLPWEPLSVADSGDQGEPHALPAPWGGGGDAVGGG